jgi:uncharacterized protein YbbC (DUF1343 family)
MVKSGLEVLLAHPPRELNLARLGLLCNQGSVGSHYEPAWELIAARFPGQLTTLFSPQHGLWGEKQDNMIASPDCLESRTGLPVYSLYGERLVPPPDLLQEIDILLIDLPDIGTRVYTFAATMAYSMAVAAAVGTRVIVLDRPNPLGGHLVEGNLLQPACASLVGPYPLPMRHGFTLGELAQYYNESQNLGCDLSIIPAGGWSRRLFFDATALPWVLPSPNMPTLDTALVYPGQVLLEGTNLSEGRGTTRPFELWGAPYIQPYALKARLQEVALPGVYWRETYFQPTFHKWAGEVCGGCQLHITDRQTYKPYLTALTLVAAIQELYPRHFAWRQAPYEYEYDRLSFDLLTGDPAIREGLEQGTPVPHLEEAWQEELQGFLAKRREYLLYPD